MKKFNRLKLASDVNIESSGDGEDAVLLSMKSGHLYRCNHTAAAALEQLEEGATFDEMVDRIARRYLVDGDQVRRDLGALMQTLLDEELVVKAA